MIGVPITNGCSGLPHLAIDSEKDVPFKGSKRQSARQASQELNINNRDTQAQGECGIDTAAFHPKQGRAPATWHAIRQKVAGFMLSHSKDAMWQDAFVACDELDVKQQMPLVTKPDRVAKSLKSFPSGSASVSQSCSQKAPR